MKVWRAISYAIGYVARKWHIRQTGHVPYTHVRHYRTVELSCFSCGRVFWTRQSPSVGASHGIN